MAGLTDSERKDIDDHFRAKISNYLARFSWQRVLVLTIDNVPGSKAPRISARRMIDKVYPTFVASIARQLGKPVQDFWAMERGSASGRRHVNVLLASSEAISAEMIRVAWNALSPSYVWHEKYDPARGPWYWVKDVASTEADIVDYGGSVVYRHPAPRPAKLRRTRRSDYNLALGRMSYGSHHRRFGVMPHAFV